jgi:hypothetical protein
MDLSSLDVSPEELGKRLTAAAGVNSLDLSESSLGARHAEVIAGCAALGSVEILDLFESELDDEALAILAASPHLARLRALHIGGNRFGGAGLSALAKASFAPTVEVLSLGAVAPGSADALSRLVLPVLRRLSISCTAASAGGIARADLPSLVELDLEGGGMGADGAAALLEARWLPGLRELVLDFNDVGDRGVAAIAGAPSTMALRRLSLWSNAIGDAGVVALARATCLPELVDLNLRENRVGDEGAQALAGSKLLGQLQRLSLEHNEIGDEGIRALAHNEEIARLQPSFEGNWIGGEGVAAIVGSPWIERRHAVSLYKNAVGSKGLAALAASPSLARITRLDLGANQIDDEGVVALAGSMNAKALERLELFANPEIGDRGAKALAASPHLVTLTHLSLTGTAVSAAGIEALLMSPYLSDQVKRQFGEPKTPASGVEVKQRPVGRELLLWTEGLSRTGKLELECRSSVDKAVLMPWLRQLAERVSRGETLGDVDAPGPGLVVKTGPRPSERDGAGKVLGISLSSVQSDADRKPWWRFWS